MSRGQVRSVSKDASLFQHARPLPVLLALILATAVPACTRSRPSGVPSGPTELHVAAASDLHDVLGEIIGRYGDVEPGVKVVPTFGPSGQLARQIGAGAPFGLFLSANERFVRELAVAKHVEPDSVRPY